jgi:hypothetical protein
MDIGQAINRERSLTLGSGDFTDRMRHSMHRSCSNANRERDAMTEDAGAEVPRGDISQDAWHQLPSAKIIII